MVKGGANERTSMGALTGSKNLEAVVVRGKIKPEIYASQQLKELARWGSKNYPESAVYAICVCIPAWLRLIWLVAPPSARCRGRRSENV